MASTGEEKNTYTGAEEKNIYTGAEEHIHKGRREEHIHLISSIEKIIPTRNIQLYKTQASSNGKQWGVGGRHTKEFLGV